MRFGSYIVSIFLHATLVLLVLYWPSKPKIDLSQAVQISLVEGAPGGELKASPVLGHEGDPSGRTKAEAKPAPEAKAPEAPAQLPPPPEAKPPAAQQVPEPPKAVTEIPRPESILKPVTPPPPPPPDTTKAVSETKPEPKPEAKVEPKPEVKPEVKPPAEQKKPEAKKPPEPSREDALKAALADVQKQAKPQTGSSSSSSSRDAAVAGALAEARQNRRRGTGGGGGGEGDGPGGGGLLDTYRALVTMAVRAHWSMNTFSDRRNIVVKLRIKLDREGNVLECYVEESSGNPGFDGSAVNAVKRAKVLPAPPTPDLQDLLLALNSQEM